jgi:two-component system LytT family response regulator
MHTIIIADRKPEYRQQIRRHLDRRHGFRVLGEFDNSRETIRHVNALEPDVLFLDVELGGGNAFELTRNTEHLPKIIYTASDGFHAQRAFDFDALDYILKPFGEARLDAALQKVSSPSRDETSVHPKIGSHYHTNIFVEDGRRLKRTAVADIRYLKAAGDYTIVYTSQGEFLSSSGIGLIEQKLDPNRFIRVHRSFIVNAEYIDTCYRDIGRLYLVMENAQEIRVGKNYMGNIKPLIL